MTAFNDDTGLFSYTVHRTTTVRSPRLVWYNRTRRSPQQCIPQGYSETMKKFPPPVSTVLPASGRTDRDVILAPPTLQFFLYDIR